MIELTADRDGRMLGLHVDVIGNVGAYAWTGSVEPPTTARMVAGPYAIEHVHTRARSVLTNTVPTSPYRGPGRAEATLGLEQAVDLLARRLGVDPVELRRRNLLPAADGPTTVAGGLQLDAANFTATLDRAVALADIDRWRDEQAARRAAGDPREIGIGVATWVDVCASLCMQGVDLRLDADGRVSLRAGTAPAGQGHATTFRDLVADRLGLGPATIRWVDPDTDEMTGWLGSFGSRTAPVSASAAAEAADVLRLRLVELTARLLEADPADVVVHDGDRLGVRGVPATALPLAEIARLAGDDRPAVHHVFDQGGGSTPSGCHVAVVEVDTETGRVVVERLVAATDGGTVLDPVGAAGQVEGGALQGVAQALFEEVVYDDDGNPLATNFADYGIPAASELPGITNEFVPTPSLRNPLGVKGIAESGMLGAPAACANAVVDALATRGVEHVQLPCTPEHVWLAVHGGSDAQEERP